MWKAPVNDSRYEWTNHAIWKMRAYRLSPSLIKRLIRYPHRTEEGIAENTIAVMRPNQYSKKYSEIWVMYTTPSLSTPSSNHHPSRLKIITAWRYPGKSPKRDPIPNEIISEIKDILF